MKPSRVCGCMPASLFRDLSQLATDHDLERVAMLLVSLQLGRSGAPEENDLANVGRLSFIATAMAEHAHLLRETMASDLDPMPPLKLRPRDLDLNARNLEEFARLERRVWRLAKKMTARLVAGAVSR